MLQYTIFAIFIIGCVSAAPASQTTFDNSVGNDNNFAKYVVDGLTGEGVNVNKVIDEVEEILNANPQLPRLSRTEILRLLQNITEEDKGNTIRPIATKLKTSDETKPIMVVLPYNAAHTEASKMKELYTRPPIVTFVTHSPQSEELEIIGKDGAKLYSTNLENHRENNNVEYKVDSDTADYWKEQVQKVMDDLATTEMTFKELPSNLEETSVPDFVKLKLSTKYKSETEDGDVEYFPNGENTEIDDRLKQLLKVAEKYNQNNPVYPMLPQQTEILSKTPPKSFSYTKPETEKMVLENKQPTSETSAYTQFKPLPSTMMEKRPLSKDVQDILASYGIVDSPYGWAPSFMKLKNDEQPTMDPNLYPVAQPLKDLTPSMPAYGEPLKDINIDPGMFPADMTSMLTEMGLAGRKDRKMSTTAQNNIRDIMLNTTPKLSADLDMLYKDILASDSNEVRKRQKFEGTTTSEPTTTVSESSTEIPEFNVNASEQSSEDSEPSTTTTESTPTTTEESKGSSNEDDSRASSANESPSIADLENSFGASPADDDPSEAELPPPRRNGFYYMLDWNSFLEVGEGDSKVNIRFDPKLGDPQRFLKVTVP